MKTTNQIRWDENNVPKAINPPPPPPKGVKSEAFQEFFRKDPRNSETPYKAIVPGKQAIRFRTATEAFIFFQNCETRCLISFNTNTTVKYVAYKYK